ncbi:MAG: hypothetical protein ACLGH0_00585, partial [Thermoanaerobaculia bacterium]
MNRPIALILGLLLALPLAAAEKQRYLIASRDGATAAGKLRVATNAIDGQERRVRTLRNINAFAADLTAEEAADLQASNFIVEPLVEREVLGDFTPATSATEPDETTQSIPWGLTAVDAQKVWPVTRGQNVNVAVLDTGIDYE